MRDKGSVRLRCVTNEGTSDNSSQSTNERVVEIENLAMTITELSSEMASVGDAALHPSNIRSGVRETQSLLHAGQSTKDARNSKATIDCIYVDHDHYYDLERPVNKTENWKVVLKTMKSVSQRGEQFIASMMSPSSIDAGGSLPVFAVADISFWALRDFGTCLMKRSRSERSAGGACGEMAEAYPKFRRIIKTLGSAIESFMKRNGHWSAGSHQRNAPAGQHQETVPSRASSVTIFLYGRADDRFDMVTLEVGGIHDENHRHSKRR